MPEERVKILSLGPMDSLIEATLRDRFELYRGRDAELDAMLREHGQEIRAIAARGHDPLTASLMDSFPKLELIANYGVGYETIDVQAAAARGIVVTNTPDVLTGEMADFTVGVLLATVRKLPQADRHLRSGKWAEGKSFPLGSSLRGRSIGIAGMGRIGKEIARRLSGFDVSLSYFGRAAQAELDYPFYDDLVALAKAVDTLIVLLPGAADTRRMVDADVLAALGPEGILINVSRGSVVDEQALIEALQKGAILAAGLDVFEHEPNVPAALLGMEQVVLLPHIGTATYDTRARMGELQVRNIVSWFAGDGPVTPVKETPWSRGAPG